MQNKIIYRYKKSRENLIAIVIDKNSNRLTIIMYKLMQKKFYTYTLIIYSIIKLTASSDSVKYFAISLSKNFTT